VCIWTGVVGFWATLSYPLYALLMPASYQKYLYTLQFSVRALPGDYAP
jgi:hypothetical protein